MSEFSVHRTADTIPALRYCLVLDGERIAGGKPDYRGNNHLISWSTRETYGPVDDLMAENAKLRELCATVIDDWMSKVCPSFPFCEYGGEYQDCTDETCGNQIYRQMARELRVEVDG